MGVIWTDEDELRELHDKLWASSFTRRILRDLNVREFDNRNATDMKSISVSQCDIATCIEILERAGYRCTYEGD